MKLVEFPRLFRMCRHGLAALAITASCLSVFPARAIDPLPAQLEKASLEQQFAWREKMGRESMAEKRQVAERRHEQRTAVKRRMVAEFHNEAAQRRLDVASPPSRPLALVDSGIASPNEIRWVAILSGIVLAGYFVRRWMHSSEAADSSSDS